MKIGDVKVGEQYAALESPRARGYYASRTRPRQVEVTEITTREERQYTGAWTPQKRVKIRRVMVKFLDDPVSEGSSWDKVASAKKGSFLILEAAKLIGPWGEFADKAAKLIAEKQELDAASAALDKRIDKLFGKGLSRRQGGYAYGSVSRYNDRVRETLRVEGTCVDQLLTWAEAGKAARGS